MTSSHPAHSVDCTRPIPLRPDNFTPLTRTPWAGTAIARLYKEHLVPEAQGKKIGESWEFSCDPIFPSRLAGLNIDLRELMQERAVDVLGAESAHCEILIKLLNPDEPLSLQVHPSDDDVDLRPGECGKPESWYVLNAEPGAGIYLGFNQAVSREELRRALLDGDRAKELLQFVPVRPGDYFEIEPGVPHCVAPGVTLLEPQRVVEGLSGKTYRLWDFGRRYNESGQVDMKHGRARDLHLEAGLRLIDPQTQTGDAWVNRMRCKPRVLELSPGVQASIFPANRWYQTVVVDVAMDAEFTLKLRGGYAAMTVVGGTFHSGDLVLPLGQSALLPAACMPLQIKATAGSKASLVFPAHCEFGV